ncbi:hypothetical protein GGI43DRAFT_279905 [Trichoderma evansii]
MIRKPKKNILIFSGCFSETQGKWLQHCQVSLQFYFTHNTLLYPDQICSIYFFWSYHSPEKDIFDFQTSGKNVQLLLDYAKQAGLYVIARPGPSIWY